MHLGHPFHFPVINLITIHIWQLCGFINMRYLRHGSVPCWFRSAAMFHGTVRVVSRKLPLHQSIIYLPVAPPHLDYVDHMARLKYSRLIFVSLATMSHIKSWGYVCIDDISDPVNYKYTIVSHINKTHAGLGACEHAFISITPGIFMLLTCRVILHTHTP